ncbi:dipeptidyl-peptidase 3 family protein [Fluviicola taffensis]|uniref:Dipeptidyl-peptidase III n=1 Tax=Fluviicola taffensis (strain DSM 16823 / NCIMB 13979 / RW262) TaxID=755732 RepID=F2IE06_FLUTR|nr:dihydrofolate reductase [Fluviicola taffensis]AEA45570.1 Dipeptidyl-peptidase III [Fluviicola taffensis DSM 16823]
MKIQNILAFSSLVALSAACGEKKEPTENEQITQSHETKVERFADVQILRFEVPSWDKLSIKQKELVYYLSQAGLAGRDINYDQNNRFNLEIRRALESIHEKYTGDKTTSEWGKFDTWSKQVFFSNGIHHHYSMDKIKPNFSQAYFEKLMKAGEHNLSPEALAAIFDPELEKKRKVKNPDVDMIVASANNFYGEGVTQKMVEDFYKSKQDLNDPEPIELGLNSTLILEKGKLVEDVWKSKGKYGLAIDQIIFWLKKAVKVAENDQQAKALKVLIDFYKTGSLKKWDEYNILWATSTKGDIDWINGFIEVYGDALGKRANYESMVQINDFEASKRMSVVAKNAQWFEDNSPLMPEHKKKKVVGVSYKVVEVANESGESAPSTPIGVNLPNNNWIRDVHGSKSVSLGNIIDAYNKAGGPEVVEEFANDQEEINRANKYGSLAGKMHTALHEVLGHASGQLNKGVGQPSETLENYASTLEEARADLVGLYYIMDQKMVDLGLIESLEVGKAEYDGYIRNGLLTQLQRLEMGQNLEEEHMQNRQLVSAWVFEKGLKDKVIEKIVRNGKTYYDIKDYKKLRVLFGELLREIQRIKSEGDYKAGKNLVETYGVKVDSKIHAEVLKRVKPLNIAPYNGFVYPVFVPIMDHTGKIKDIKLENKQNFIEQMLYYGKNNSFLY